MADRRRFGTFELDVSARTLRRDGQPVKLHDQPLELLIALTDRPGHLVNRDELRRRLWPDDTFVDYDNSLNNALSRLRDCLEDGAADPRFIETVPKRGYRFIAAVHPVESATEPTARRMRVPLARIAAGLALMTLAAAGWLYFRSSSPASDGPRRLLVLPLENLTGDAGLDYVVDGLSDDLMTHLGRLSPYRLAVIARTTAVTYARADVPLSRIASELAVDHVIEGAVRRNQDQLHVTIRLVRASDAGQVWAEMFDGRPAATAALFHDVVRRTAGSVAATFGEDGAVRARAATLSTDAFDAWLRARHQWNRFTPEGFTASIEWNRRALALDPTFAQAAAGLAQGWVFLGIFDASRAAEAYIEAADAVADALRLDPDSIDAIAMRAMVKLFGALDRNGAARDFEAAVARAPHDALTLHWAAAGASARGDHERGLALARAARALDPKSVAVNADLGWYFYYARRFGEALDQCTAAASLDPSARGPALCREMVLRATHRSTVARRTYAASDRSALYRVATDSAALGDRQAALHAIRTAVASRASWAPFIGVDPAFEPLRGDAEFTRLIVDPGLTGGDVRGSE